MIKRLRTKLGGWIAGENVGVSKWHVSYQFDNGEGRQGFGQAFYNGDMRTFNDIEKLQTAINDENGWDDGSIVVISFRKMEA